MRVRPIWNNWQPAANRPYYRRDEKYSLPSHEEWPELYNFHPGELWDHDLYHGKDLYILKEKLPSIIEVPWEDMDKYDPDSWHEVEIAELNRRIRAIKRQRAKAAHPAGKQRRHLAVAR